MNKETLLRLANPLKLAEHITVTEILSRIIANIHLNHHYEPFENYHEGDARTTIQMILSKAKHLVTIGQGIELVPNAKKTLIDPTALMQIERNVFETVIFFNSLYILPQTIEQQITIYKLWQIATLKFKQRFHSYAQSTEAHATVQEDINLLQALIEEIRASDIYVNGTEKTITQIDRAIDRKSYWIVFEHDGMNSSHGPQQLCDLMTKAQPVLENQYTMFSLYTHPSKESVNVFTNIYRDESYKDLAGMGLRVTNCLLSMFIHDYVALFPNAKNTFEEFDIEVQAICTFYNKVIREPTTCINDTWGIIEGVGGL